MDSDFEVMPVGTLAECMAMRKFANELIDIVDQCQDANASETLRNLLSKVREIREFYDWHSRTYPMTNI